MLSTPRSIHSLADEIIFPNNLKLADGSALFNRDDDDTSIKLWTYMLPSF